MGSFFDKDKIAKEILELEKESQKSNFWQNEKKAKEVLQKLSAKKEKLKKIKELEQSVFAASELALALEQEGEELGGELAKEIENIEKELTLLEGEALLSGKYDKSNALLSIYSGAGGVDAQDWAEMLLRMYLRFAEKKNWGAKILSISSGDEAGIKSATLEVLGELAYGYLKNESGVHRLVRLSPFNAQNLRQTSFALVDVIPEVEQKEIKIDPQDLKIDTFRASGAGGQHVNVTDSAVRITHLPTKITASSQSERSQHQNKETALKIIVSKLAKYHEEKSEEERARLRGEISSASWGNQIRSYVLHPYKQVKDHRTGLEIKNTDKVLGGDIEEFIEKALRKKKF